MELASVLGADPESQKSFTLTIPWSLARLVKISCEIIAHQLLTVQKQMGLLREKYVEFKKGRLRYCCNRDWIKLVGGFHGMLLLSAKYSRPIV